MSKLLLILLDNWSYYVVVRSVAQKIIPKVIGMSSSNRRTTAIGAGNDSATLSLSKFLLCLSNRIGICMRLRAVVL